MKRKSDKNKRASFYQALQGKKLPILTLDNKWYYLLDEGTRAAVKGLEEQLNSLIKRQGKLNTEIVEIHKLKKKLIGEIVPLASEADQTGDRAIEKKIGQNRKLVEDCNERLDNYKDELKELPTQIDKVNFQLMMMTMDSCYDTMQSNAEEIRKIETWVDSIRIELKKRLVRKQEMEQQNHNIYAYMHDVFGADVVDVFDMHYNPEKKYRSPAKKKAAKETDAGEDGVSDIIQ